MELSAILDRIKNIPGVQGCVIVNDKRQIVYTTLEEKETTSLGAITIKVEDTM